jgi:hypothetical protein
MPFSNSATPVEARATTLINDAHREFAAMAPSMLKKKMVETVFLPWLSTFTGRVVRAAKEEERQAILASLPSPTENPDADPAWIQGHKDALETIRSAILQRCENGP